MSEPLDMILCIPGVMDDCRRILAQMTLGAALTLTAAPACADWQYTRWGMSVDEVLAAGSPQAYRYTRADRSNETEETLAAAPYSGSGLNFTTYFRFGRGTRALASVAFALVDMDNCPLLLERLKSTYGEGKSTYSSDFQTHRWIDIKRGNTVSFSGGMLPGPACGLKYLPHPEPTAPVQRKGGL